MTPVQIAQNCDIVFLMLAYPRDVESMVFDPETGILGHMKSGSVLVDHTTSSPGLAIRIAEEAQKRQVGSVDAPVSGGDVGAKNGSVVVMAGGDAHAIEEARPYMDCYSQNIQNMGGAGAG